MNFDRHWIVSTYNQDPTDVLNALDGSYEIFNQGEPDTVPAVLRKSGQFRQTHHSGHNLSDYFQFILENYDDLPDEIGFAKGNLFPRHISRDAFLKRREGRGFAPLYSDSCTYAPSYHRLFKWRLVAQQITPGLYFEINNSWYCKTRKIGHYYPKFDDLFRHLFQRSSPRYNLFVPGACMIVPAENIRRWPRDLFKHLHEITTYRHFPVEAFHVERAMFHLFGAPQE